MRSGRGSSMQDTRQTDRSRPAVNDRLSTLKGAGPRPGRSNSDGNLGSAAGECLPRVDASQDARGRAPERPARVHDDQVGSASGSYTTHGSFPEHVPSASDSYCSLSALSGSRWWFSDRSEYESSGSSAWSSSNSESHSPRSAEESEVDEQQEAEWRKANEAQHAIGACKPCLFHGTEAGCAKGRACRFCHLPHAAKRRARPSRAEGMRCKQLVAKPGCRCEGDADAAWDSADGCSLRQRQVLSAFRERGQQQGPPRAELGGLTRAAAGEKPQQPSRCS
ncbi:unnamed protein product [Prorocentrum cordatum]|uniref:C3H1-type domain-containing protein n=1 Tax=Prorocentrum cordatum TaxID=2364126 RepID=A0ABN9X1G0_9DINO|nr:unnamed protein product [Polarella glacialis]